ncbi:MAG: hypothetical protein LW627_09440, partial [Ilumatobacteraceae bacterium]|nr:hypothetical protein [Ilumatobacteraceae bacterium]
MLRGDSENQLVRTFRPRRRRLGAEMGDVYERLIDQWSIDEDGDRFDPRDSFVHASTTILEIGCGRGDLAVSYARAHPNDA